MLGNDTAEKQNNVQDKESQDISPDEQQLKSLGYTQQLPRSLGIIDSFSASFGAVNFIASVRLVFFLGILAGGPLAMWTSYLINSFFALKSSSILCEICSALPVSGSIYIWAAVAAGPKWGRFVGCIVAWWVATAWITFVAIVCQGIANYLLSLVTVYNSYFHGGVSDDNVNWRTLVWIVSEGSLAICFALSHIPRRWNPTVLRVTVGITMLDFVLCLTWLPIGASRHYGLRSAREALLSTYNGTGAKSGWNWMLSFLFTSASLGGFDAAGHIAEETKDANIVAARSIFTSTIATAVVGFSTTILFLFCTPDIETLFSLNAPQPFVLIYSMALGRGGSVVMTLLACVEGLFVLYTISLAASRIIFAIARDGSLPFSSWVRKVSSNGRPQNATNFLFGCCAILLCSILPSASAFTSLMSAGVVPMVAAYGVIALLRLIATPDGFQNTAYPLGRARKVFYASSAIFNAVLFAVLVSPYTFPVTASKLNFGRIIFGAITLLGVVSFWFTPEDKWLSGKQIEQMYRGANTRNPEVEARDRV